MSEFLEFRFAYHKDVLDLGNGIQLKAEEIGKMGFMFYGMVYKEILNRVEQARKELGIENEKVESVS